MYFIVLYLLVVAVPVSHLKICLANLPFVIFFQVALCQKRLKEQHEKDKRIYANMFQKFAERDSKVKVCVLYNSHQRVR